MDDKDLSRLALEALPFLGGRTPDHLALVEVLNEIASRMNSPIGVQEALANLARVIHASPREFSRLAARNAARGAARMPTAYHDVKLAFKLARIVKHIEDGVRGGKTPSAMHRAATVKFKVSRSTVLKALATVRRGRASVTD